MMNDDLVCFSAPSATHRLVLLHGWGADCEDLIPLGQVLSRAPKNQRLEIISLRAPHLHPQGFGRQWYGLFPEDWDAVPAAIRSLQIRLGALPTNQISLERTILLGFSQGAAMALAGGCDLPLAGLISCSGYPHPGWIPPKSSPPVVLCHGFYDEIVPTNASQKLLEYFQKSQIEADLVLFEGGHEIPEKVIPRLELAISNWCI